MDLTLLNEVVNDSGLKKSVIAERMGMSRAKLHTKLKGLAAWRVDEARQFGEAVGLTKKQLTDIFLSFTIKMIPKDNSKNSRVLFDVK